MSMVELTGWTGGTDNKITMLRVLMVLEDYGEMMYLQTVLKKIGFDVDAIQNPRSFEEHLLRMNPDLLLMTAHGKRVHGLQLAQSTKKVRGLPHILLLHSSSHPTEEDVAVNRWLPSPVSAISLLDAIAEVCGLNQQVLQEKFQRLKLTEVEAEHARVLKMQEIAGPSLERGGDTGNFGMLKGSSLSESERKSRYQKFLAEPMPEKHGFEIKQVQEQVKALRKDETPSDLEDLERERKLFVEHLFKKKA